LKADEKLMSFTDIILLKRLGLGILSVTGALALLLAGWLLLSAFNSEPDMAIDAIADNEVQVAERTIASVPSPIELSEVQPALQKAEASTETVALGCLKDGSSLELKSSALQLRIKGRICEGYRAELNKSSIVNRANGFEATLFNLESGHFSSDYIALVNGANKIVLEIEDGVGGRAITELTILRAEF
jgi:hypothetical protein